MRKLLALRGQFLVYLAGGFLSAAIDVGAMAGLMRMGMDYRLAATIAFLAGLFVNYAFHSAFTFRARATAGNFTRYLCVVALNYGVTMLCIAAAVHSIGSPLAGKLVSLPLIAVNGFVLSKFWIYR
ncbi:MAG: GtrA family protein [Telluria sp.]